MIEKMDRFGAFVVVILSTAKTPSGRDTNQDARQSQAGKWKRSHRRSSRLATRPAWKPASTIKTMSHTPVVVITQQQLLASHEPKAGDHERAGSGRVSGCQTNNQCDSDQQRPQDTIIAKMTLLGRTTDSRNGRKNPKLRASRPVTMRSTLFSKPPA